MEFLRKNFLIVLVVIIALLLWLGKDSPPFMCSYSAGNVGGSITTVHTDMRGELCKLIIDSLFAEDKYVIPNEYVEPRIKNSTRYIQCYFKGIPNEIYTMTTDLYSVMEVYNVDKNEFRGNRDEYTDEERSRIEKRVQNTLLKDIEQKAKEYGICDCEIYGDIQYDSYINKNIHPDSVKKRKQEIKDSLKYRCRFISHIADGGYLCFMEDTIDPHLILQLSDSLNGKYDLPEKYREKRYIDMDNYRLYYFASPPEEVYFIEHNVFIIFLHIYDFASDSVKNKEDNLPVSEIERIQNRFRNTVIKDVVKKARGLGIPDSEIFKRP